MASLPMNSGLCASCRWAAAIESARGSVFLRCGRSDHDPAYRKYPPLPVRACAGFELASLPEPDHT